jgi:hypothetical protein
MLLAFPIELPDNFFEEIGCVDNDTQFAAFYTDFRSGRLIRENGISLKFCPESWLFAALKAFPIVEEWCQKNRICLSKGVHWLVYDYYDCKAYVADCHTASECLTKQTLPKQSENGKTVHGARPARRYAPRTANNTP